MIVKFKGFPLYIKLEVLKIEHGFVWMRWWNDSAHDAFNGDFTSDEWSQFHKATGNALEDLEGRTVIMNANLIEYMR